MRTIKKLREDKSGSILILTMLALVGAISIAVAMSSISIVERKMTTKSRKSTTAFQSANSGIEWAMKKINDADSFDTGNNTVIKVFPSFNEITGRVACPDGLGGSISLFADSSKSSCEITLLKRVGGDRVLIDSGSTPMEDIVAIRSSGTFGSDSEQVGRSLEAYAMPNCGTDKRVADFCIEDTDRPSTGGETWSEAIASCESAGKRLCSAAELVAAQQAGVSGGLNDLIAADVTTSNTVRIDEMDIHMEPAAYSGQYRCCRNR